MASSNKIPFIGSLYSTNRHLEINNLFALVGLGIILKIIFNSKDPATSTIWGYGLSAVALFLLLMISISFSDLNKLEKSLNFFNKFIHSGLPNLLLLIIVIWTIVLNVSFLDKINSQHLPQEYNLYSFLSSIIVFIQAITLFLFFNEQYNLIIFNPSTIDQEKDQAKFINNETISYLLTLVNTLLLGMMQIVLTFFTTDG